MPQSRTSVAVRVHLSTPPAGDPPDRRGEKLDRRAYNRAPLPPDRRRPMTRIFCAALLVLSGVASAARAADEPPSGGMPAPTESTPPPDSAAPGSGGGT